MFPTSRSRPLLAAVLIAAPLCEVVEALFSPLKGTSTAADVRAISLHQSAFVASVLIGLAGTVLYVPAFVGLAARAVDRSRTLALVGGALAVLSMLGFAGVRMGQAVELQGVRQGLPDAQLARLVDGLSSNPIGATLLVMFLGGSVVGVVCLAVAVWRAHLAPWPAAVLFLVFPIVDLLAPPSELGTVVSHVVLLAGLGWIGVAQLRDRAVAGDPAQQQTASPGEGRLIASEG
jgi:hypothetical protein